MIRARLRCSARVLAVLAALVLVAGCVRMPDQGPVVETGSDADRTTGEGYNYDPLPPQPDATPVEIVQGFLDAMMAAPIQLNSARQFLSSDARTAWQPERSTITYVTRGAPAGTSQVTVQLPGGGDVFDARGMWRGALPADQQTLSFSLVVEDGQWRIGSAPDALIVSEQFFAQRFRRAALYYFDPTARILVPEPVFVPTGEQLATTLVKGLLDGPGPGLERVSRSFLPPGLDVELSVPVSPDGVATIALAGPSSRPTSETGRLMATQLAWTLRQVPGIERLRVTMGDAALQLPGLGAEFSVDLGDEFDPTGQYASAMVFGLRDGLLVAGTVDELQPVDGPFGSEGHALRGFAVDLDASSVAGIAADGRSAVVAPVFAGRADQVQQVLDRAANLLPPAWDFDHRLWLVDRTRSGATVLYRQDRRLRVLRVPGITGQAVRSFLVSRDGSRLLAVVRRARGDVLVVSRIQHDETGQVVRATPARTIGLDRSEVQPIRDIAWVDPTTVAALTRVSGQFWEVRTVSVDGAPSSLDSAAALNGAVRSLVGSPAPGQGLVVLTDTEALDISGAVARPVAVDPAVAALTYVG